MDQARLGFFSTYRYPPSVASITGLFGIVGVTRCIGEEAYSSVKLEGLPKPILITGRLECRDRFSRPERCAFLQFRSEHMALVHVDPLFVPVFFLSRGYADFAAECLSSKNPFCRVCLGMCGR